jgi:hypothetical protein
MADDYDRLRAQLAALIQYVRHTEDCNRQALGALGCICGLRALLDAPDVATLVQRQELVNEVVNAARTLNELIGNTAEQPFVTAADERLRQALAALDAGHAEK